MRMSVVDYDGRMALPGLLACMLIAVELMLGASNLSAISSEFQN